MSGGPSRSTDQVHVRPAEKMGHHGVDAGQDVPSPTGASGKRLAKRRATKKTRQFGRRAARTLD